MIKTDQSARFEVVGDRSYVDYSGAAEYLRQLRLFKSLSILSAARFGILVPPSLLLVRWKMHAVEEFALSYEFPVMIRLDYRHLPNPKPLGGIPLRNFAIVKAVCGDLFKKCCAPLLHPNWDRFHDVYSAGVLLKRHGQEVAVEIVGSGFDAGDLRLGKAMPHEVIAATLSTGSVSRRDLIPEAAYERERLERQVRIKQLLGYIDFVNTDGKLAADLAKFHAPLNRLQTPRIPTHYKPIPDTLFLELLEICQTISRQVLRTFPDSSIYVASLSYLSARGWVLWDVYGDWYKR